MIFIVAFLISIVGLAASLLRRHLAVRKSSAYALWDSISLLFLSLMFGAGPRAFEDSAQPHTGMTVVAVGMGVAGVVKLVYLLVQRRRAAI